MMKKLILLGLCLVSLSAGAEETQTVILNSPNNDPSPCGYTYNGNQETNNNSVTFTQNGNYSTETYSTGGKNPYPYYGSACNNNSQVITPNVVVPPYKYHRGYGY